MQNTLSPATVPSLAEAKTALTKLATTDALEHLEAALRSLQSLAASLQKADRLPPGEQRELEKALLRFRTELRDAGTLADQGLAYCQEWADLLQPPPAYQSNGAFTSTATNRPELSIEA
jgi:hypothetical protein